MSVLKMYFDKSVNQCSPVAVDYNRVVNYDEDGIQFITYEKVDLAKFQQSLGLVDNWSLDSLVKAGIDPRFGIHTGFNTRLEGIGMLDGLISYADSVLAPEENNEEKF